MRESINPMLARAVRLAAHGAVAVGVLAATTACSIDKILKVEDPDVATPTSVNSAAALPILLGGAIARFHSAYMGTSNVNESSGQIGYSGLLADELRSSDTFPTRNQVDQRNIQLDNGSNESQFIALAQARSAAQIATTRYLTFGPDEPGLALAFALDGYSTILFGEDYCSGVPFSTLTDAGVPVYGDPLTTTQIFERAVAKFDSALASSALSDANVAVDTVAAKYKNLALVGKARAQLDLGQFAAAGATAAQVKPGFVFNIEARTTTGAEYNGVYIFTINTQRLTAVDREGGNGLDYLSAGRPLGTTTGDPRVVYKDAGETGFDNSTPLILQEKYTARTTPAVLASYTEAQLIVAEAQLQAGNYAAPGGTLAILNTLRATVGLAPLTAAATQPAQVDQLFRERAFWMYLTAHRLGDLRRLVRQYTRGAETVFPTGPFFKGGNYGSDVNMPVPKVEENNPKFHGCIDRNA
jgi:starch-binding outer membrane protein, SusD/RagB family